MVRFGVAVENLLHEREERGMGEHKKWVEKYSLPQILDPDFRAPAPAPYVPLAQRRGEQPDNRAAIAQLRALAGIRGGVKQFQGKGG